MCTCKKNSRLETLIKYLAGRSFDCTGGKLDGKSSDIFEIYGFLLSSLYQLDNDGNRIYIDYNIDSGEFEVDVNRTLYVGSFRSNADSKYLEDIGYENRNFYEDIVNLGFKPCDYENPIESIPLTSYVIDAEEGTKLHIEWNEDDEYCSLENKVSILCLPKVNFSIYEKYDDYGTELKQYDGHFGIKRNGYESIGYFTSFDVSNDTSAVDSNGYIIKKKNASVLMLPINSETNSSFKLLGHSDGEYESEYDVEIEEYTFESSVDYGEETNARGTYEVVNVNFVNEDSIYEDLVPSDSCQFLGYLQTTSNFEFVPFGTRWNDKLNGIYCNVTDNLIVGNRFKYRNYKSDYVKSFIGNSLNVAYRVNTLSTNDMYLYNIASVLIDIQSIGDDITVPVKRLPVLDLTGALSIDDFDSSKPYIYVSTNGSLGVYLFEYSKFDTSLKLQVVDNSDNPTNLDSEKYIRIYCSSTKPVNYLAQLDDGNATGVYNILCSPAEMNETISYEITKI